jgi:hypothetical protein
MILPGDLISLSVFYSISSSLRCRLEAASQIRSARLRIREEIIASSAPYLVYLERSDATRPLLRTPVRHSQSLCTLDSTQSLQACCSFRGIPGRVSLSLCRMHLVLIPTPSWVLHKRAHRLSKQNRSEKPPAPSKPSTQRPFFPLTLPPILRPSINHLSMFLIHRSIIQLQTSKLLLLYSFSSLIL